jgi:hypothetical protein
MEGVSLPQLLNAAHEGDQTKVAKGTTSLPLLDSSKLVGNDMAKLAVQASRNREKKVEEQPRKVKRKGKKKKRKEEDDSSEDSNEEESNILEESQESQETQESQESQESQETQDSTDMSSIVTYNKKDAPVIPPRLQAGKGFTVPDDDQHVHKWFRILSPREQKGIDGPYNEIELKLMYKMGDLNDNTMIWCEGQTDWEQLLFMKNLRPRLIQIPIMPPKSGEDIEAEVYNPITALPDKLDAINAKALNSMPMNLSCSRCGSVAIGHMSGVGVNQVDFVGLRKSAPMKNNLASQIIPGLLWVGSSAAAKLNPILDQGFTLIINCTSNLGNPKEKLPYFRCKTVPMVDKPKGSASDSMASLIDMLEKVYDWIELERISPERAAHSDPLQIQSSILEKTDKYGRAFKTVEEKAIKIRIGNEKRTPRILLWSRKGMDRPNVVAAAYMIRQYGMPLDKVLQLLDIARPGMMICRYYKNVLEVWSHKYTLGELLCIDCLNLAKNNHSHLTHNEQLIDSEQLINDHQNGPKHPIEDQTSVQVLSGYLDMIPSESNATKITRALGNVQAYLPKIYNGTSLQSGWTGLLDLNLYGTCLGDEMITDLFEAFLMTGVSKKIRSIGLGSTKCGNLGIKAIRVALCAIENDANQLFIEAAEQLSLKEEASTLNGDGDGDNTIVSDSDVNGNGNGDGDGQSAAVLGHDLLEGSIMTTDEATTMNLNTSSILKNNNNLTNPNKIIAMAEKSVIDLGHSFREPTSELISFDISDNKITYDGALEIAEICRQVHSIITLNVSYNNFTDNGSKEIIDAITPTAEDFLDDGVPAPDAGAPGVSGSTAPISSVAESSIGNKTKVSEFTIKDERCNMSITSINMSCCNLGHTSSEKLLDTFRENTILNSFIIDYNHDLTSKEMKYMMNAIRSYSKCLQRLSLADMDHSVKTIGYITRLLENWENNIMILDLTKCNLSFPHMKIMCSYIPKSKVLEQLSLGSNDIGNDGANLLAKSIKVFTKQEKEELRLITRQERLNYGESLKIIEDDEEEERNKEHQAELVGRAITNGPPLNYVDFTHMNLPPEGSKELFKAICTRDTILKCKMSGNNFMENIDDILPSLEKAKFHTLHLNECKLGTKGCISILKTIANTDDFEIKTKTKKIIENEIERERACQEALGSGEAKDDGMVSVIVTSIKKAPTIVRHLLSLDLSGNSMHDVASTAIAEVLMGNMIIQYLDLGFNKLTDAISVEVKKAYNVVSSSRIEKKVFSLHVNVVGNKCDPYMLGEPGMGRSKMNYRFGINSSMGDDINDGYSHINQTSRAHNFQRKDAYLKGILPKHNLLKPIGHMN